MGFTTDQQDAIDHDGHLLIVAGPGSGKTTTSVAKARRILTDPKRRLVMVTFTKEGADEMRRRLDKAQEDAGDRPYSREKLRIGTFHSIALQHLHAHRPKQNLLSPVQQGILLNEALSPYILNQEHAKDIRVEFESYMYAIDRENVELTPAAMTVIKRYTDRVNASRATDLYTVMRDCALLAHQESIPPMNFTDMLVDEGQDTDELQKVWIFAHARAGINVTIVGDDDQSIYEWRNALGYAGMKSFMDTYRARRIELGDNFRSREEILTHAVTLVECNENRLRKHLVAKRGPGGRIAAYHTNSSMKQCEELAELIRQTPEHHSNTVVLARRNHSLNELEMTLTACEIPYIRVGKSIWNNMWVATYLSLLQSLLDSSPVGVLGCLRCMELDDEVKTELFHVMEGNADEFLSGDVPRLDSATPTDARVLKEFADSCKYWRNQLSAGSHTEVVLDVGAWLALKQRSRRTREVLTRASEILGKLSGTLTSRLYFVNQNKKPSGSAPVTLMTMHGSKGLEYDTVHVIDANKPEDGSDLIHVEAERRLMYVAMTRAKDRCFVWYSGAPHPTISEAALPVLHQFEKLVERVNS